MALGKRSITVPKAGLRPGQFETDPMIARSTFATQNEWLAFGIFDDDFLKPVVKQIADRQTAPHSQNLQRRMVCIVVPVK